MENNDNNFRDAIESFESNELFEYIKPALAEAINKLVPFINAEPSLLSLNEEGCIYYNDTGVDKKIYSNLAMPVTINAKPSVDIVVIANAFNIRTSVPFTRLFAGNEKLTSAFREFMSSSIEDPRYKEELERYNGILETMRKRIAEDEFMS